MLTPVTFLEATTPVKLASLQIRTMRELTFKEYYSKDFYGYGHSTHYQNT